MPATAAIANRNAILFDLDGTLIDSARITCAIIDQMLAARGSDDRTDSTIVRAMDAVGGAAMIAAVMGRHCHNPDADIAEFRARHAAAITPPDLAFPAVAPALAALHGAGIRLAICSNKPQALCDKILADLDLARYFGAIIGARPDLPRKPAPDAACLAMASIGADAANCLYVGDSAVDVATAHAVGLPIILVGWGYGLAAARSTAPNAPVVASMDELVRLAKSSPAA